MIKQTYMKFRKYLRGDGRATRSEYWAVTALSVVVTALVGCVAAFLLMPFGAILELAYRAHQNNLLFWFGVTLFVFIVVVGQVGLVALQLWLYLAVCVRRLHDCDFPGWFALAIFVPVGGIILFIGAGLLWPHTPNRYGADPRLLRGV